MFEIKDFRNSWKDWGQQTLQSKYIAVFLETLVNHILLLSMQFICNICFCYLCYD